MKDTEDTLPGENHSSSVQEFANAALKLCNHLTTDFKSRADRHKRAFKFLKISSVSLAIAVTVLATLSATQRIDQWVVPVVSGFAALCTALLGATNAQERWVSSREIQQHLEAEQFL